MADNNSARYRSDPLGRGSAPAGQTNDPLAELARLIGRNDPFAELESGSAGPPQRAHIAPDHASSGYPEANDSTPNHGGEPWPRHDSDPAPRYGSDPAPPYDSTQASRVGADYTPHYEDEHPPRLDWPSSVGRSQAPDPFSELARQSSLLSQQLRMPPAPSYEGQALSDPRGPSFTDDSQPNRPDSDDPAHEPTPGNPAFRQTLYPQELEAGSLPPPQDDEFYDDMPRPGRRKGLLTVAAVLALAVIGTAGAFGYRSIFGGASSPSPPPVIRASAEPNKVAPAMQPVDQAAGKFSYDRFGDRGQNEKVVLREEKPVDNLELGRTSVPRTVLPGAPGGAGQPAAGAQSSSNPPSALGEPRRVRTVPIRPDGPDNAATPQSSARQQAAPMQIAPAMPPPPPARQPSFVAEAPVNSPVEVNPPPVNVRPAPPRSNPRVAARSAGPSDNAPLSLSPDASHAPQPPMAAREAPPPRAAAPARVAAAPAGNAPAGNGGGYLVQVSSQKSEADAQSSYRSIQSRYSNVLSGQRHFIRRADLGSRGVYYRALVGPFGSREQAVQLCGSLKAAGGDCVVQAN